MLMAMSSLYSMTVSYNSMECSRPNRSSQVCTTPHTDERGIRTSLAGVESLGVWTKRMRKRLRLSRTCLGSVN